MTGGKAVPSTWYPVLRKKDAAKARLSGCGLSRLPPRSFTRAKAALFQDDKIK